MLLKGPQRNGCVVICILLNLSICQAKADTPLAERFLSEAPRAWKQIRELALAKNAEINSTSRDNSPDGSVREFVSEIRYNGMSGNLIFEKEHTSGPWANRRDVDGINPKYSFHAERKPEQPLLVEAVTTDSRIVMDSQDVRSAVFMSISANFIMIDELVADPSFSIDRIASVRDDDRELVEVHFRSELVFGKGIRFPRGRFLLDRGHLWSIVECVVLFTVGDTADHSADDIENVYWRTKNEYSGFEKTGFPVPRRQLLELTPSDDLEATDHPVYASRVMEFVQFGPGDVSSDDCTLTAIGLSEPAIVHKRSLIRTPFVIMAAVLLIGVVAVVTKLAASRLLREESPK